MITKILEFLDYKQEFENQGRSDVLNASPSMVAIFVAINLHLLLTRVVSLDLNGSNLEQMSDDKDGRLPLGLVDIWNESFGYSIM